MSKEFEFLICTRLFYVVRTLAIKFFYYTNKCIKTPNYIYITHGSVISNYVEANFWRSFIKASRQDHGKAS